NPYWPEKDVQDLLAQHLTLTRGEVDARLNGEWDRDIAAFDDIMTEILTLADALSAGIVKQFPEQFGSDAPTNGADNGGASIQRAQTTEGAATGRVTRPGPITASSSSRRRPDDGGSR